MRNIKTTLRIVRNSALLFAAASGMSYLTACSENDVTPDNGDNNGNEDIVLVEQLGLTVGTNPNLAKTYDNSHQGTRSSFDVPEHPTMPEDNVTTYDYTLDEAFMGNPELTVLYPNNTPEIADLTSVNSRIEKKYWSEEDQKNDQNAYYELHGATVKVPAGTYNSLPEKFTVYYQCNSPYWRKQITVYEPTYYIEGTVVAGQTANDGKIDFYVRNGGELSIKSTIQSKTTIYLYEGGKFLRGSSEENKIYLIGNLVSAAALGDATTDLYVQGNIYTYGKIHGKTIELNNGGEIFAGCAVTAEQYLYITNSARVSAGYVSAPTVKLDSSAKMLLRDGGYLEASEELYLPNANSVRIEAEEGEYAMIETDVLNMNEKYEWNAADQKNDAVNAFRNIAINYNSFTGTDAPGDVIFHQSVNANGKGEIEYSVEETGDACAPKRVNGPAAPPTPGPELENIGTVAPTEGHSHPISATCIYTNGQDAYLSWHTQGTNFHGCIEYLTVANGNVTLNAYLETAPSNNVTGAIDFNHVIFDNGKIFVAGDHPSKGGILGWIECNNGGFVTGEATLNLRQLYNGKKGGSGNCIIRNGNYYQVASIHGFETYNVSDFVGAAKPKAVAQLAAYDFDPAGEEATGRQTGKHIAIGGGKVAMLTLINRDNELNTATASIKVYNASDVKYENEVASYIINDAVLSPVDGKDVIAINGNDIWVCLGKGGVQHLRLAGNTISKVSEFVLTNMSKEDLKGWELSTKEAAASCANGLAVDNNYVYVAHGGAGLVVLNKENLSLVTRTRYNGGKSANYVNLNPDGYIYVAYGQSNIQVFGWKKNN